MISTREAFGEAIAGLGLINKKIVVLDGDVKNSTCLEEFFKKFPKRSFQSFIAEQNMVGAALGLSKSGFIPFVATFASFLSRAHDQIRMAGHSFANIKFVGSHAGVSIGANGPSQMGLEDMAIFSPIPDSIILYPSDAYSTMKCVSLMADHIGISYLRLTRSKTPLIYSEKDKFKIGGSKTIKSSDKDIATVVTAGVTVHNAIKAYDMLIKEGIYIRVIDAYSIKPLDEISVSGNVIVVEDHFASGGLGCAVRAVIKNADIHHLAVKEVPRSGTPDELMEKYGISANAIIKCVKKIAVL